MLDIKCDKISVYFCLIFLFICFEKVQSEEIKDKKYGILTAESSAAKKNYCIIYFPIFSELPVEKEKAEIHILQDLSDKDFCYDHKLNLKSQVILLLRSSNCSLVMQAQAVQDLGGTAALFIMPSGNVDSLKVNSSEIGGLNITVALISSNSAMELYKTNATITACMFAPARFRFDFSILIIWIIAMFPICVGGYWSGIVWSALYSDEINNPLEPGKENTAEENLELSTNRPVKDAKESSLSISPCAVVVLVIFMITTLLLLYFFFEYLVYFFITVFFLASIQSVYSGLHPLTTKVIPAYPNILKCLKWDKVTGLDYRNILLFAVSTGLSVFWIITRKQKYSWVMQDILGVFFCIDIIKTIRLPSFKICTLLLILLFFYDIFFVFVTPFFAAKGESVMEKVVAGSQSGEMFPMVLKVPYLTFDYLAICYQRYFLLGFGDVIVPGLLVAYCHGYDLIFNGSQIYFGIAVCSYGFGLLITFVSLFLMSSAQPALLYLVPITLLPPIILSLKKGEFKLFWVGFKKQKISDSTNLPPENAMTSTISNTELLVPSSVEFASSSISTIATEVKKSPKEAS